jgi:tetratricopeptide (TPR) repeat protein
VISTPRLYASLPADGDASALGRAAGAAGAQVLLEGSIYDAGDGRLRLDLRRVDLAAGEVVQAFVLEAADLFAIADSGTARLVASLGLRAPVGGLATVSTTSPLAYRLYEEGLRAYFRNDLPAANRLFEEALGEDSTFAMAVFYALQSHTDRATGPRDRAVRLAARTSDRERLTMLAFVASFDAGTNLTALADSLLTRYPHEVEGYLYSGIARMQAARYPEAVRSLQRAVEMDSVSIRQNRLPCYGCTALRQLISTYQLSDSLAAAEREARRWIGFRPDLAEAWRTLAETLDLADQGEQAKLAIERAAALDPVRDDLWFYGPAHFVRGGDFTRADSLLRKVPAGSGADVELAARELLGYSLRSQGRLREAAELADWPAFAGRTPYVEPARVLLERGEFRQAAAIFDSIARWPYADTPPHIASHRVLYTALAASALADAGDYDGVRARIDTIADLVPLSGIARSRAMLHYLRGLIHVGEGRDVEAIAEFREAMYSPNLGTPRVNIHLARALLRQDRAAEAVTVMQAALRGRVQPPTSLVLRTEIHRLLGGAWAAAGRPDSAAWHYERVLRAWQHADPEVRVRRDSVAAELRRLRR